MFWSLNEIVEFVVFDFIINVIGIETLEYGVNSVKQLIFFPFNSPSKNCEFNLQIKMISFPSEFESSKFVKIVKLFFDLIEANGCTSDVDIPVALE